VPTYDLKFTTHPNGHVPAKIRLLPEATYEAVPKTRPNASRPWDAEDLISWIQNAVFGDLRTLRVGIEVYLQDEERRATERLGGGNFFLAAGCFMALEYVARVFSGHDDASRNVREYAMRFLKPINPKYAEVADLLWRAFRNGLVHGSWPQVICSETDPDDRVRVGVGVEPGEPHLGPDPAEHGKTFVINAIQFAHDLEQSVEEGLAPWLRTERPEVLQRGSPRLLIVREGDELGQHQLGLLAKWSTVAKSSG
jgi:hypothetical protein